MRDLTSLRGFTSHFTSFSYKYARNFGTVNKFSKTVMNVLANFKSTKIKRVFVLEKITKFDLEVQNGLTPAQIHKSFPLAYNTHLTHKKIMESLLKHLKDVYKLDIEVVKAQTKGILPFEGSNNKDRVRPDLLISAGGDGTFLEAASLIPADQLTDTPIWLAGLNTDPERSLGSLCMSYFGPKAEQHFNCGYYDYEKCQPTTEDTDYSNFQSEEELDVFNKNLRDFCSYTYQKPSSKKIVFNNGNNGESDHNNNDNEILHLISYDEYVNTLLKNLLSFQLHPIPRQRLRLKLFRRNLPRFDSVGTDTKDSESLDTCVDNSKIEKILLTDTISTFEEDELKNDNFSNDTHSYYFPYGIMNDVMIADQDFGKTFYAIVQVDDKPLKRIKSSGVLVTTGTGSTAWAYNVMKMNFFTGTSFLKCFLEHPEIMKSMGRDVGDDVLKETIECFNQKLKMDPSRGVMRCLIREPISDRTTDDTNFYNCKQVKVLPLSKNAVVCVDGSKSIKLGYGDVLVLKTFESDLIWSFI